MKRAFLLFLSIGFFQGFAFAQSQPANLPVCPKIYVIGPSGLTEPGGLLSFTANIEGFDASKLKFEWTIANGEIIKGRETLSVGVRPECESTVTVTFKVSGLPENCPGIASESALISHYCGDSRLSRKIDEYGKITDSEEKTRLDRFADELQNFYPSGKGFLLKSFLRNVSKAAAYRNLQRILNYLELRGVAKERIIFGATYGKEELTSIYLVPPGAERPEFNDEILDAAKLAERLKTTRPRTKKGVTRKPSK